MGYPVVPAGIVNPMTAVGDLIVGGTAGAPLRQAEGANGTFLGVSGGVVGFFTPPGVTWPLTNSADETFQPNSIANNTLTLHNNASAVNGVQITGAVTGSAPLLSSIGTDTNVGLTVQGKGSGAITVGSNTGGNVFLQTANNVILTCNTAGAISFSTAQSSSITVATGVNGNTGQVSTPQNILSLFSANAIGSTLLGGNNGNASIGGAAFTATGVAAGINGLTVTQSAAGAAPSLAATGTDTNIALNLVTKGTGALQINGAAGSSGQVLTSNGASAAPTWSAVPAAVAGLGIYGDGSDGTQTFDGAATILGVAPSANTYTMNRDWYLAASTINNGVSIITNGWRLFVQGTLTNNGTIQWNGTGGAAATAGAAILAGAGSGASLSTSGQTFGTAGGNGQTGAGSAGTNNLVNFTYGAGGGNGGNGASGGGAGGTVSSPGARFNSFRFIGAIVGMIPVQGSPGTQVFAGGAGGGGGGGDGTHAGGGGGAGGGTVFVMAKSFAGTGSVQARGGAGGNAAAAGTNSGGGGGGGGGLVIVVSSSVSGGAISGQSVDANGGAGGTHLGTGADGATGSVGTVVLLPN